ncbi:TAXI family TRAP transporter solute-binding subunit [Roseibium sediminicola]|uniref:TAXI family TRAP transporter solute-binding subunit n=1 Tax=Roseibium sediminicola TaxID=2933272 RepID=A0ABT0GR46_9HYPH|nr:TAXI family TRAP transporter solute-binding subunit [Roseibium sp. CAU 1639]MCK7611335.1 TAXI family TRAP transporter solute-binding subunit [Roseibium sp. CAU 1639]
MAEPLRLRATMPRRFFRKALIPALALAISLAIPMQAFGADQHFVTIGTGGVTGVYYPSGGATCKIVNRSRAEHGVRCSVETTFGSIDNIEKIRQGEIDFGYVQSDWQSHAYHGTSVFEPAGPFEDLRAVFSLHTEVATIVVREDSEFRTFADLKHARINVGAKGSGSAASWRTLISRLGWTEADQTGLSDLRTSELAEALCTGTVDAFFVLIGHPAALIEETQADCNIRLIGIDGEAVDSLLDEAPYYIAAEIPAGFYGLKQPVPSFGVVATFVTSAKMPDEIVSTMVKALSDHFDSFRLLHPALNNLKLSDMVAADMAAPLHPGALTFYRDQGLLPAPGEDTK